MSEDAKPESREDMIKKDFTDKYSEWIKLAEKRSEQCSRTIDYDHVRSFLSSLFEDETRMNTMMQFLSAFALMHFYSAHKDKLTQEQHDVLMETADAVKDCAFALCMQFELYRGMGSEIFFAKNLPPPGVSRFDNKRN